MIHLTRARATELLAVYLDTHKSPNAPGAILARINMYREAAGLAPVVNDVALNPASQACAKVLHLNPTWPISHYMPSTLVGWTRDAARAAANGCIDRQDEGARAIGDMMRDWGMSTINQYVPHRRWLLHPGLQTVGIGSVSARDGKPAAVAVYVRTPMSGASQAVAWPPAGDVPIGWVPERWSYSTTEDLSAVAVYVDGRRLSVAKQRGSSPMNVVVFNPPMAFNVEQTHRVRITGLASGPVEYTVNRFKP